MTTWITLRNNILLGILGCYILLNYGFMQVRFPFVSGSGLPIGEALLLGFLLTLNGSVIWQKLRRAVWAIPFLIWWVYVLFRSTQGFVAHGIWAFRDATHVIETLFIIVGFAFAANMENIKQLYRVLPWMLLLVCVYSLGFPFQPILTAFSPRVAGGSGQSVPLIFMYANTSIMLLLSGFYILIFKRLNGPKAWIWFILAAIILAYTLSIFQARMLYLELIAVLIFLSRLRPKVLQYVVLIVGVFIAVLGLFSLTGIEIKGRLNQPVNLTFFWNHFLASFGIASEGLEGAASGVSQRLSWWSDIFARWSSHLFSVLFGLGFGEPLTGFQVSGSVAVREPHNSFLSILARTGLLGMTLFVSMQILLIRTWKKTYRLARQLNEPLVQNALLITMIFFIQVMVVSLVEDGFEKPFNAIPYYFMWGVILRWYLHLKNKKQNQEEFTAHADFDAA